MNEHGSTLIRAHTCMGIVKLVHFSVSWNLPAIAYFEMNMHDGCVVFVLKGHTIHTCNILLFVIYVLQFAYIGFIESTSGGACSGGGIVSSKFFHEIFTQIKAFKSWQTTKRKGKQATWN